MDIDIIAVPIDLGADRHGVDMGLSAIRYTKSCRPAAHRAAGRQVLGLILGCRGASFLWL